MDLWEQLQALDLDLWEVAEAPETCRIRDAWNAMRRAELPHLVCCEKGRKHIHAFRTYHAMQEGDHTPQWTLTFSQDPLDHRDTCRLNIQFCPFCATPVPALVKKAVPPLHLCEDESEQYCGHCNERLMKCLCSFPEAAWEVA